MEHSQAELLSTDKEQMNWSCTKPCDSQEGNAE